ncbi:septum formation initiator family protein [Streptomyces sp. NBC_00829]|uniref:FtsB family cell division protein n=1 Tax=Streptomyces sp. NBC_00829 TaxID=2903679 RepID=UPI0038642CEB
MNAAARQLKGRAARLARLMPSGPSTAARAPFVLLVVLLLGGGLITLLLLNSSLNEGSFELSELKRKTTELTDEQQALQRDVDNRSAPGALERRARELGMVPGGSPAFLNPDGTVRGVPGGAGAQASPNPSPMGFQGPVALPSPAPSSPPSAKDPAQAITAPASLSPRSQPAPRPASKPGPHGSVPAAGPTHPPAKPTPTTPGR